jgi:hypothetical protein
MTIARSVWWSLVLAFSGVMFITPHVTAAASATTTDVPNPDAYSCSQPGYIDFEKMPDGTNLSSGSINGVHFTTTGGYTWLVGDWATGTYNGKYPTGYYTSQGTRWAWLGENQGAGRIDFANGPASVFSLLVSNGTPIYLDAYAADGSLLTTAGPAQPNYSTGHMTELKVTRDTADMAYVIVHDTGNFFLVDSVCTNAPGVPRSSLWDFKQYESGWASQHLYNNQDCWTMTRGGCAITALADVLGSYGLQQLPDGTPTNPGNLDGFLTQKGDHNGCLMVWESAAADVGYMNSGFVNDSTSVALQTRINVVNHALQVGDLVIAGINLLGGGLHYVVLYAPGASPAPDGSSDYLMADPDGKSGALSNYGSFDQLNPQIVILHNGAARASRPWVIVAHSPVQLLVTDPTGAQTGYDPASGTVRLDIPGSTYAIQPGLADDTGAALPLPDVGYFGQSDRSDGTYAVEAIGTGVGPYTLDFVFDGPSVGSVTETVTGTAAPNVIDTYTVTASSTPGQPPIVAHSTGATYVPLTPTRILDSRYGTGLSGAFSSHVARTFQVTGQGGVPSGAVAVTGNLTVTQQTSLGFLFIGPAAQDNPTSSTLNFPVGDDRANAVTVALSGTGALSVTYAAPSLGPTAQVIFDVTGYFTPDSTGATYVPLTPTRILDSRYGTGLSGAFSSHVARTFQVTGQGGVPSGAVAVTGNLTVTQQTSLGFLFIGPAAQDNPTSSTLNFPVGDDRANAVTVALSGTGALSVTYAAPSLGPTAQVIFDVTGYFTP